MAICIAVTMTNTIGLMIIREHIEVIFDEWHIK